MSTDSKSLRRKIGTFCIAIAILMLIAGETVLKNKLSGIPMLCYWLACFVLTAIAAGAAVIDRRDAQADRERQTIRQVIN